MTRTKRNADGTVSLMSFSYRGDDEAGKALQQNLVATIEENNRQARAEWDSLTPKEREQRTRDFEAKRKALSANMSDDLEIPPHILALVKGNK